MRQFNEVLQYRNAEYFMGRDKYELFVFDLLDPVLKVAGLTEIKSTPYFNYPGLVLKATTTPCIALSDLHGLRVRHRHYHHATGSINGLYGLKNAPYVGVQWDKENYQVNLPTAYFWNDIYNLLIL